ncbi:RNA polymerase sigma factor [Ktedonospora formicarum]|uniref:RNA polymerase sigma factor n=1 Tax=Ktedonospora formicarum TaxID=2778364 RepID=UPI001C68A741|nr:RNA polymerase sigma factor [Ktedonospora formicarum]
MTSEASLSPQMMNDLSDEGLISATANGSIVALEAIYDRYHQLLYSLAYRMVADHQLAEDMLQEAFVAVWQHAITYAPKAGSVKTWLCSIIHHRAIDYIRKANRRSALNSTTLDAIEQEAQIASPDAWDGAWRHIQGEQVRDALTRLPKEQRLVIEMAYFGGWTHTEIAEGCQVPLGTVKARMRLGLHHLRRLLADKGMDDFS